MSKRARIVAVCGVVVVVIPVGVVFAGGFEGSETFGVSTQTYDSIGPQTTDSKQFSALEGLEMSDVGVGAQATLSAVMTSGKAKFRFVSEDFDPRPVPEPADGISFTAPGANSYAFYSRDGCGNYSVEWKRQGRDAAALSSASLQGIGDESGC